MADGAGIEPDLEGQAQPHNIEAEQALLGALLVNNDVYDRVSGVINESHLSERIFPLMPVM